MRPFASKTATEKSWPSRACSEYAVLWTVVPISTAIDWSAPQMTPSVIGSTAALAIYVASLGELATSRLAYSSTVAEVPGGSTVVDSRSSTIAGPSSRIPAASA